MKVIDKDAELCGLYLTVLPDFLTDVMIIGSFDCAGNRLTTLLGSPAEVHGDFSCSYNRLTSLKGSPAEVGGDFFCSFNQLTSLQGSPAKVYGNFYCGNNPGKFTEEDVRKVCKVGADVICHW